MTAHTAEGTARVEPSFHNLSLIGMEFGRRTETAARFREFVRRVAETQPRGVWYANQAAAFRKAFDEEYEQSEFAGIPRRNADAIENRFQSLFPEMHPRS